MIRIFYNFYQDKNADRNTELKECLDRIISNPHIGKVFILVESDISPEIDKSKCEIIRLESRPTYKSIILLSNMSDQDDVNIIINSDCFLGHETTSKMNRITSKEFWCLSRLNIQNIDTMEISYPKNEKTSQDCWVFRGKVDNIDSIDCDFTMGLPGCDNRIAALFKKNGYVVSNPAFSIKVYHNHKTQIRNYVDTDRIQGEYQSVPPYFFSDEIKDVSVCTACMNRNDLLMQALLTWIHLPVKEIIIVDWNSKEPIYNELFFKKLKDDRIKIVRVENKTYYNQSKASNLKVRLAKSNHILSIDCDIKITSDFFNYHPMDDVNFFYGNVGIHPGTTGTCLISKEMFEDVNGYNELMDGWGFHDVDFYKRLKQYGFKGRFLNHSKISHIEHDENSRVDNYEMKNKRFSNSVNRNISIKKPWKRDCKMETQDVIIYRIDSEEKTTI